MSLVEIVKEYLRLKRNIKKAEVAFKEVEFELARKLKVNVGKLTAEEAAAFNGLTEEVPLVAKVTHYCGNTPTVNWEYIKTLPEEVQAKIVGRTYWTALKVTPF